MIEKTLALLVGFLLGTLLTFIFILLKELIDNLKRKKKINRKDYAFRRSMGYTNEEMEERSKRAFGVKIK